MGSIFTLSELRPQSVELSTAELSTADLSSAELQARIRFLQDPAAWAALDPQCRHIETVETQMSWVFLGKHAALKLKKPIRTAELDFTTLQSRVWHCQEELRLNARLAPGVYQGLMALVARTRGDANAPGTDGHSPMPPQALRWREYRLRPWSEVARDDGASECVVWMRRLPKRRMMSRLMAKHQLRPVEVDRLGETLARFYAQASRVPMDPTLWSARYRDEWAIHRQVLLGPWGAGLVSVDWMNRAWGAQALMAAALAQRCAQGAFVEGHGDLRPDHVCFWTSPVVIDALEFNARLRWVDPADELDYLALECEVLGAAWVGPRLWSAWQGHAAHRDTLPSQPLRHLYRLRRSLLRARLCVAHLMSPRPRTPQRWRPLAKRYLQCANESLQAIEAAANSSSMALDNKAPAETTVTL